MCNYRFVFVFSYFAFSTFIQCLAQENKKTYGSDISIHAQNPPPQAKFTCKVESYMQGNCACTVKFVDLSTDTVKTWWWDFGDGTSQSSLQHPVHCYFGFNKHDVCLYVTNNSGSDSLCIKSYVIADSTGCRCPDDSIILGFSEKDKMDLELFPVPFHASLNIILNENFSSGDVIFRVYNSTGEHVLSREIRKKETLLNLEALPSGIYFYSLENNTYFLSRGKLLKSRQ